MAVTVGLVGGGRRATEVHAPVLVESPDIDFVGVWTRRPASAEELAQTYGIRAFPKFKDLLASCEAVSFAIPPVAQTELGVEAAKVGKHVFLEVPIAWDIAGAEALVEAVVASKVISQVAFTWRYTETVRRFLTELAPHLQLTGARGRAIRPQRDPRKEAGRWREQRGLLLELGPHVTEFLDAALGEIVEVDAFSDQSGSVGLKLEHRLVGSSESFLNYSTAIEQDHVEFEFFGEEASTFVDLSRGADWTDYAKMFAEFAQAVNTREPHELDVRRGLHVQRVVEAADTALLQGN
jgi:predicted dehydrogenase